MRTDIRGFKGDLCECGRRRTVRHCPSCGSTSYYARKCAAHKSRVTGEFVEVKFVYHCRPCYTDFIDDERNFCEAPPVSQALARKRVQALASAVQTGEQLSPTEQSVVDALKAAATPEQAQALEPPKPSDQKEFEANLWKLRNEWADLSFAFKEGKGDNPGPCDFWLKRRVKELWGIDWPFRTEVSDVERNDS